MAGQVTSYFVLKNAFDLWQNATSADEKARALAKLMDVFKK